MRCRTFFSPHLLHRVPAYLHIPAATYQLAYLRKPRLVFDNHELDRLGIERRRGPSAGVQHFRQDIIRYWSVLEVNRHGESGGDAPYPPSFPDAFQCFHYRLTSDFAVWLT